MMKKILFLILMMFSFYSNASEAHKYLNQAITACPSPNNPYLDGLTILNGNQFSNVKRVYNSNLDGLIEVNDISADVYFNPRIYNSAIGAATQFLGKIKIRYARKQTRLGTQLVCSLDVITNLRHP